MRFVLARLRELLVKHPMVTPEPARVRFFRYGAYSKDVEVFAYLRCQSQGWRDENQLPFSELEPARKAEIEDTLDFPPKGA
jgi:hypothetical protein